MAGPPSLVFYLDCDLKKPCTKCKGKHLGILCEANSRKPPTGISYLIRSSCSAKVLLKVLKVLLSFKGKELETYAILDDGSQRTMLLSTAAYYLELDRVAESLALRTVRQGTEALEGSKVTFNVSSASNSLKKSLIKEAFTSIHLGLDEQTCPAQIFCRFRHLQGLPVQPFTQVKPVLLTGSDHSHLLCPIERVHLGPGEGPAAVHTCLGWALQGPTMLPSSPEDTGTVDLESVNVVQILFLENQSVSSDLRCNVEKLWQVDVLPFQSSKSTARSKQDLEALAQLKSKTVRVAVAGINRYATPLLQIGTAPVPAPCSAPWLAPFPAPRATSMPAPWVNPVPAPRATPAPGSPSAAWPTPAPDCLVSSLPACTLAVLSLVCTALHS